jgi:phosphoglycolate phosphatase
MNYDLIVFDLDGTLVDSIPDIADIYNSILRQEGFPEYPVDDYRDFVGWGLKKALAFVLPGNVPEETIQKMMDGIIDEYRDRPAKLSYVYPGISQLLGYLRDSSVPMIVYTNKPEELARSVVESLFPRSIFEEVLGYTERFPHKPDPSALKEYIQSRSTPLSSILMVGDTPVDLETARNAAVSFAGASWGFRSESVLREAGSDKNFSSPAELHRWLMSSEDVYNDK